MLAKRKNRRSTRTWLANMFSIKEQVMKLVSDAIDNPMRFADISDLAYDKQCHIASYSNWADRVAYWVIEGVWLSGPDVVYPKRSSIIIASS